MTNPEPVEELAADTAPDRYSTPGYREPVPSADGLLRILPYSDGGIVTTGSWTTNTTGYPETIVTTCGQHRWRRTELDDEGDDAPRE